MFGFFITSLRLVERHLTACAIALNGKTAPHFNKTLWVYMTLNEVINEIKRLANLSNSDIAKLIYTTENDIDMWLCGKSRPEEAHKILLVNVLNDLLGYITNIGAISCRDEALKILSNGRL